MITLKRITQPLDRAFEAFTLFALVAIVGVVLFQVAGRELLATTPGWSEEIARLLLVWIGFLGAAIGFREGAHIAIEIVTDRLPRRLKQGVIWFVRAVILLFGAYLVVQGGWLVVQTSGATLAGSGLPRSTLYLVMPLSGLMICLYTILQAGGVPTRKYSDEASVPTHE